MIEQTRCLCTAEMEQTMPAIITHDFFGRDVYDALYKSIGSSKNEADAFLLGNQGPDPLFYCVVSPSIAKYNHLGSRLHHENPTEVLAAFKSSLSVLSESEVSIGRAYALGFWCHYFLDSAMHPFVYYHEFAICDAGEPDLDRTYASEVHAVIESELDELVLYKKRQQTISEFNPSTAILKASDEVLRIISKMYAYVAMVVFGETIPQDLFARSVRDFRLVQRAFYSPSGMKRYLVGSLERTVRPHSFFQSMSHRPVELHESIFDNRNHNAWKNPFTDEVRTDGFWDIYHQALSCAKRQLATFDQNNFNIESARALTHDLNFSGEPTVAVVVDVQDLEA